MGAGAAYLGRVLGEQSIDEHDEEGRALEREFGAIRTLLTDAFAAAPPHVELAGSLAKGSLVRAGYDLDVACYFANGNEIAGETLAEIYATVKAKLDAVYVTRERRSSIRLTERRVGTLPFTVDVVPGRYVDDSRQDVFLHQNDADKQRLKTNLRVQIDHVKNSGFLDPIRLAKLWRLRADVNVRTFLLELLCIEALRGQRSLPIDEQVERFWTALRDDIESLAVADPANPTGNDLSPLLEESGELLSTAASVALDVVRGGDWTPIFGDDVAKTDRRIVSPATLLRLGDASHAHPAPWPTRRGTGAVRIAGSAQRGLRWAAARWKGIESDSQALLEGTDLRFNAHVSNVPPPYEVKWQVVNTGQHAIDASGLRGDEFFRGHKLDKSPTDDQHVNFERGEYTGKHWIECFVVKDGQLWARSGRFFVNVINRKRASRWFLL